jgi:hypothetical protein
MGLFKTHKFFIAFCISVNGCYAHSAIPTLAFRLATVIVQMQWRGGFSPFSSLTTAA